MNKLVAFSSSDSSIASVDEDGIVTAHAVGSVEITASVATCTVNVVCSGIPDYTLRIPAEFTVYCYELSGVAGWAERNGYSVSYLPMLKLNLPRAAKCVEEEAFAGTAAQAVVLPDGCTDIDPRAFAGSDGMRFVYMPDSVERIADDAFEGCGSVTFLCESENAAAAYAQRHSIPCVVE